MNIKCQEDEEFLLKIKPEETFDEMEKRFKHIRMQRTIKMNKLRNSKIGGFQAMNEDLCITSSSALDDFNSEIRGSFDTRMFIRNSYDSHLFHPEYDDDHEVCTVLAGKCAPLKIYEDS